jgi:hypothetical protein
VDFALTDNEQEINRSTPVITIFNNHLKSRFVDPRYKGEDKERAEKKAADKRKRQATEVANIVKRRFEGNNFNEKYFVVCGDFNDDPASQNLADLLGIGLENAINRIANGDVKKEWTYYHMKENTLEQIDYLLISPALARNEQTGAPIIERRGIADYCKLKETQFYLKKV